MLSLAVDPAGAFEPVINDVKGSINTGTDQGVIAGINRLFRIDTIGQAIAGYDSDGSSLRGDWLDSAAYASEGITRLSSTVLAATGIYGGLRNIGAPQVITQDTSSLVSQTFRQVSDSGLDISSPVTIAQSLQGSTRYPGVDAFRNITLRPGTFVYAGVAGESGFFTTARAVVGSGGDATALNQGLQIAPKGGLYRPGVTVYMVTEETPAAFGRALNNPQYGGGGLPQLYIPDYKNALTPIQTNLLNNRAP